jgi:hypothetical protein
MKFTRRPDLAPQTRIEIVKLAWLYQGVYGKMTEIAQYYQISRTFLYQLLLLANLQLGRQLLASASVVDLTSSGIPSQFRRLS